MKRQHLLLHCLCVMSTREKLCDEHSILPGVLHHFLNVLILLHRKAKRKDTRPAPPAMSPRLRVTLPGFHARLKARARVFQYLSDERTMDLCMKIYLSPRRYCFMNHKKPRGNLPGRSLECLLRIHDQIHQCIWYGANCNQYP